MSSGSMRLLSVLLPAVLLGLSWGKGPGDGGGGQGGAGGKAKEFHHDGVFVKVLGQSGKIMVAPGRDVEGNANRVMVEMDELIEKDEDDKAIKDAGSVKHSFKSFANQEFTFSDLSEGEIQGINNTYFTFESQLKDLTSKLKVTVYIIKENGSLTFDDETQDVYAGMVKWSVELKDWDWCDNCGQGQDGKYVDFVISIKGKGDKPKEREHEETTDSKRRKTKRLDLGGGAQLVLSTKVLAGNTWTTMADGYPKVVEQGSKTKYVFRFDRSGGNDFFYDPSIGYNAGTQCRAATVLLMGLLSIGLALLG